MSDYVFNSSTLRPTYTDRSIAASHLVQLLEGLAALDVESDVLPTLRLPEDPWLMNLVWDAEAKRHVVLGELADSLYGSDNHDEARFFESLNRAIPADRGFDDLTIEAILRLEPGSPAIGLEDSFPSVNAARFESSLCVVTGSILVSLLRCPLWDFDCMGFCSSGSSYSFDHLAKSRHAENINNRRTQLRRRELTVRNFWSSKRLTFPSLLFGLDVQGQLAKFNAKLIPLLFRRLSELDEKAKKWKASSSDEFPSGPPAISQESRQTMDQFTNDRTFRGHDGNMRIFEEHVWIDITHRIHIFRDTKGKTVEIGYVGHHLPTSTSHT